MCGSRTCSHLSNDVSSDPSKPTELTRILALFAIFQSTKDGPNYKNIRTVFLVIITYPAQNIAAEHTASEDIDVVEEIGTGYVHAIRFGT